jgi:hypothetical protein
LIYGIGLLVEVEVICRNVEIIFNAVDFGEKGEK